MIRRCIYVVLLLLLSCGGEMSGGTSSSENAKIMGQTLHSPTSRGDKTILEYVKIEVRSDGAVPGGSALVYETFSDDFGRYEVSVPKEGSYTLYAYQDSLAVVRAKLRFEGDTLVFDPILEELSSMKMYLSHDSLTGSESVYIQGTDIIRSVKIVGVDNGYQVVVLDRLPTGLFSAIGILNGSSEVISGELDFSPQGEDTGTMVIDIEESKPLWRFSLAVGVKQEVLDHFGGESQMFDLLQEKYQGVSQMFDIPGFDGRFLFSVDSLFSFTGPYKDNIKAVDDGYDYNIYYTDENVRRLNRTDYIYFGSEGFLFFKEWDRNLAIKLLAEARGALDREHLIVSSIDTPIVNSGYTPEVSIMYDEMTSQTFLDYDINCINYNGLHTGNEIAILSAAIPNSIVLVITKNDVVLNEALITVYRSELGSGKIDEIPYLSGKSDFTGRFSINGDAYRDNIKKVKYGNLLINIEYEGEVKQQWLPLNEVGEAWFWDKATYYKKIETKN